MTVSKASQTITFPSLPTKVAGNADFSPGATASSGLTVSYTSSNTAVATIVSNQIHIVGAGTSTITASQAGNTNYNAATSVAKTLTVTANRPAPVSAVVSNPVFSFYPNPVSSAFKIDYSVAATANVHMAILNLNGQLVQSCFTETKAAGQYSKIIQINNLPNGVYLGRLIRGNEVKMFKLVVAK